MVKGRRARLDSTFEGVLLDAARRAGGHRIAETEALEGPDATQGLYASAQHGRLVPDLVASQSEEGEGAAAGGARSAFSNAR